MERMNKEELINYFIELLGDNHVLGKYLSIEEIRERLNENIENVTYKPQEGNSAGNYDQYTRTFNLDIHKNLTEKTLKSLIVHELIHALSNSKYEDENKVTYKTGFAIRQTNKNGSFERDEHWFYKPPDDTFRAFGLGINEGIVQLLASEILGIDDTDLDKGYEEEKDFSRVYLAMFGKENLINKFFSKVETRTEINEPLKYLFAEELEKYPEISDSFVLSLKNFETLAVTKANSHGKLDEYQKKRYDVIKGIACDNIKKLIEIYLKHLKKDENLQNKVEQILEALSEFHDNRINYKYGNLKLELNTPELSNAVHNIVFEKNNDMGLGKKVDSYIGLTGNWHTKDKCKGCKNSIENHCIKNGIVDESKFSKSGMLAFIFETYFECSSNSLKSIRDKDLRNILSNFSYTKVGSHYELLYHGADETIKVKTHSTWFDEYGKMSNGYEIYLGENGWNISGFNSTPEADRERAESLRIQLQKISDKSDKQFVNAFVFGNDVIMNYKDERNFENRIVYTLDDEGNLVLVQEEKTRRLTDDLEEEKINRGISKYINTLRVKSRANIVLSNILFDFSMSRRDITVDELREILIASKNELDIKINFSDVVNSIFSSNLDMTREEKKDTILSIARDLELDDRYALDTIDRTLRVNAELYKRLNEDMSDEIDIRLMQQTQEIEEAQAEEESRNEEEENEIKVGENNFQNIERWMSRYKNWYGFIDRMMENAKTTKFASKLISIKSDIVRTISSIFKQRTNNQIEDEQRKDDTGR